MSNRLIDGLLRAHRLLDEVGVSHALIGGLAANLYRARARATRDVDFAVAASASEVARIAQAFRDAGWQTGKTRVEIDSFRFSHDDFPHVDLLIAGTDFERSAILRAERLTIDRIELSIVTPEDLAVYKLLAGRAHDYEAVAAVVDAVGPLDEGYVVGWLDQFGFAERWAKALEEVRRIDPD